MMIITKKTFVQMYSYYKSHVMYSIFHQQTLIIMNDSSHQYQGRRKCTGWSLVSKDDLCNSDKDICIFWSVNFQSAVFHGRSLQKQTQQSIDICTSINNSFINVRALDSFNLSRLRSIQDERQSCKRRTGQDLLLMLLILQILIF